MKLINTFINILYEQEIMEIDSMILEAVELEITDKAKQQIQDIGLEFGRGYARWILQRLMDKSIKEENIYNYINYFKYFEKGKSLGHFTEKDIFKYKDPVKFQKEAIQSHEKIGETHGETPELNEKNLISSSQIQQLENVGIKFLGLTPDNYQVFKIPKILSGNHEAFIAQKNILGRCQGREHGSKVSLCTMGNQSSFDFNLKQDDLYIFFNMKDSLSPYQFHYASEQFMDKNDHSVYNADIWIGKQLTVEKINYIKNFFIFLIKTENRDIPIKIKLKYFKNDVTDEEIKDMTPNLKYLHFPDKINKNDMYHILHDELYDRLRAIIYNEKLKREKYSYIQPFDIYGPNIALGQKDITLEEEFININGDPDITGVDPKRIRSRDVLIAYFNQSQNKIEIGAYDYVSLFGKYSPSVILYGKAMETTKWFINKDGEKDISGVDVKKLNNDRERAAYCNTLLKTPIFYYVHEFDELAPNIAYAVPLEGYSMFINTYGKPDIKGIDTNILKNSTKYSNAYYNTIKLLNNDSENSHK